MSSVIYKFMYLGFWRDVSMPIRIIPTNSIRTILVYWLKCTCWCQSRVRRLHEVQLSPDEACALLERVKTNTSSAADREQLAHLIRVTLEVTEHLRTAPDVQTPSASEQLSPTPQAKRPRPLAKATRRRHRR